MMSAMPRAGGAGAVDGGSAFGRGIALVGHVERWGVDAGRREPVGSRWSRCVHSVPPRLLHVLGVEVHIRRASTPELRGSC